MLTPRFWGCLVVVGLGSLVMPCTVLASSIGLSVGTGGVTAAYTVPVAERLQTRFHAAFFKLERDATAGDLDYQVTFKNHQAGVLLDLHPFAGSFRLSTGLMLSDFGLDLAASYADEDVVIGDNTYSGRLQLTGETTYNRVAPYAGLGWASAPGDSGLSFVADIGVIVIGEGNLDLDASGTVSKVGTSLQNIPVESFAEFQEDLERERQKAENDIRDFTFFPLINLGLSYAF
jgi:hypothetical protein